MAAMFRIQPQPQPQVQQPAPMSQPPPPMPIQQQQQQQQQHHQQPPQQQQQPIQLHNQQQLDKDAEIQREMEEIRRQEQQKKEKAMQEAYREKEKQIAHEKALKQQEEELQAKQEALLRQEQLIQQQKEQLEREEIKRYESLIPSFQFNSNSFLQIRRAAESGRATPNRRSSNQIGSRGGTKTTGNSRTVKGKLCNKIHILSNATFSAKRKTALQKLTGCDWRKKCGYRLTPPTLSYRRSDQLGFRRSMRGLTWHSSSLKRRNRSASAKVLITHVKMQNLDFLC